MAHSFVKRSLRVGALAAFALPCLMSTPNAFGAQTWSAGSPFLDTLTATTVVASTVPSSVHHMPGNGDLNPYGVAVVDKTVGLLNAGSVLVSNFNSSANLQGTGRSIVEISPLGTVTTFARLPEVPGGTGLTTALAVLPCGYVVVGNLPTSDGTAATAGAGGLLVLNASGHLVADLRAPDINGPWDLTATTIPGGAYLYVSNVLNGTVAAKGRVVHKGSVVRLVLDLTGATPTIVSNSVIGSTFAERSDPAALVVGPTGLAIDSNGVLYVADTAANSIRAIDHADTRTTSAAAGRLVTRNGSLNGPLGLLLEPHGDIVTLNGGDGRAVETTPSGAQVASRTLDSSGSPAGSGALFGLAVRPDGSALYFVDDATNTLDLQQP